MKYGAYDAEKRNLSDTLLEVLTVVQYLARARLGIIMFAQPALLLHIFGCDVLQVMIRVRMKYLLLQQSISESKRAHRMLPSTRYTQQGTGDAAHGTAGVREQSSV